jgi:cytochrome c
LPQPQAVVKHSLLTPPYLALKAMPMSPFVRIFIYSVIVADLFALVVFGGRLIVTGSIINEPEPAKIVVAGAEQAAATPGAPAASEPAFDLAKYVADPIKGEKVASKCKACHTFDNGGPNRTGPNLFGIADAPVTHKGDFSYSSAMTDEKAKIGTWSTDNLFKYLEDPQGMVPGTKMQFNGIKDPKDRADLIAWLKTLK